MSLLPLVQSAFNAMHAFRQVIDLELLFRGVTKQLVVLRNEGVVNTRREGKNIHYSVADVRTLEILMLLHRIYCPEGKN